MINLKGKVAIVTGGCSGIGRGTVKVLHDAGAQVACLDVQDEKGHVLAKEIGDGVAFFHADVTSETEVAAASCCNKGRRCVEDAGVADTLELCEPVVCFEVDEAAAEDNRSQFDTCPL